MRSQRAPLDSECVEAVVKHELSEEVHACGSALFEIALEGLDQIDENHSVQPAHVSADSSRLQRKLVEIPLNVQQHIPKVGPRPMEMHQRSVGFGRKRVDMRK